MSTSAGGAISASRSECLVLLTGDDVPEVAFDVRPVLPERVDEPAHDVRPLARELGREEGGLDVLAHVALVALLDELRRGMQRDAASDGTVVAVLARTGRGEDEAADALRPVEGHPLRHPTAHRVTEHVGGLEAEGVHQAEGVTGEHASGQALGRGRRRAGPPMVEHDHAVPPRERIEESGRPGRAGVASAGDEHDRDALTADLEGDRLSIDVDRLHLI